MSHSNALFTGNKARRRTLNNLLPPMLLLVVTGIWPGHSMRFADQARPFSLHARIGPLAKKISFQMKRSGPEVHKNIDGSGNAPSAANRNGRYFESSNASEPIRNGG